MKARCEPGDRCVIVAEIPGCECNIGATVTVTTRVTGMDWNGARIIGWLFKDASRPLKAVDVDDAGQVIPGSEAWITSSLDNPSDEPGLFDHHLVPIAGDGELLLVRTAQDVSA